MSAVRAEAPVPGLSDQKRHVLIGLRVHRLMTTRQVWRLLLPHLNPKRTGRSDIPDRAFEILGDLEAARLVAWVKTSLDGGPRAWFLSRRGWDLTVGTGDARRYRLEVARAGGLNHRHTLGVGDLAVRFAEEARARGDRCEALDWTREVAHEVGTQLSSLGRPTTLPRIVTSDALVHYERREGGRLREILRFCVELDRSTLTAANVVDKIVGYHQAFRYRDPEERWSGAFPAILWIVEGRTAHPAETQLESYLGAARTTNDYLRGLIAAEGAELEPRSFFTTKDLLLARGPFARIWRLLADPWEPRSIP